MNVQVEAKLVSSAVGEENQSKLPDKTECAFLQTRIILHCYELSAVYRVVK